MVFFSISWHIPDIILNCLSTIEATDMVIKLVDQDCLLSWCYLVEADSLYIFSRTGRTGVVTTRCLMIT